MNRSSSLASSSDAADAQIMIANGFRQARDADTMKVLNTFSTTSKKQHEQQQSDDSTTTTTNLIFYVVSTQWMSKAWPILVPAGGQPQPGQPQSGSSGSNGIIEDDRNSSSSSNTNNNDNWRVNLGRIENGNLLLLVDEESGLNATVSSSSDDEEGEDNNSSNNKKNEQNKKQPLSNNSSSTTIPNRDDRMMMNELHDVVQQEQQKRNNNTKSSENNVEGRQRPLLLQPNLNLNIDYVLVGPNAWLLLKEKFGYDVEIPCQCVVVSNATEESPLAIEVFQQPAHTRDSSSAPSIYVPIPPGGHFVYENVFQLKQQQQKQQQPLPLSYADAAAAGAPAGGGGASSAANNNKNASTTASGASSGGVLAGSAAAAAANNKAAEEETHNNPAGNVSDDDDTADEDEYDLIPTPDDEEDRMSMDISHRDNSQQRSNQPQQPVLLLPPSTTSTTASANNSAPVIYNSNINNITSSPIVTTASNNHNNSEQPPLSSPSTNSWLNSISDYRNDNDDNDNNSNGGGNEIIARPAPIRNPHGSGLSNLGNTCFMNSTLQCLAHTDPLRKYFLSGEYERDLNRGNPLGTGGDLATQFASLLGEMWGTTDTKPNAFGSMYQSNTVVPRNFKYTLGRHAEQFVGYDQHDSQELATYLLDALHEDTNRVTFKPYVEKPEQGEDESDEEASNKAWDLHLKREDSKVLEYFMGQVKSRVQCCKESCGRVSTTFDPFMYLSVPIPGSSEKKLCVTYVPLDRTMLPQYIPITIPKTASIRDLSKKLVEQLKKLRIISESETIAHEDLCFCDVFQRTIYHWFNAEEDVDRIAGTDKTNVYQLQPLAEIQKLEAEHDAAATASGGGLERSLLEVGMRDRSTPKKYKLDPATKTRFNGGGDAFSSELSGYLKSPLGVEAAFNRIRGNTPDRVKIYNRICSFIDLCYKEAEDSESAAGSKRMRDDDGRSAIFSDFVSPDEDPVASIEERCQSSEHFQNVSRRYDVAVLEFAANKMRAEILNMENQKKKVFPDGILIQIRIRKYQSQAFPLTNKEQSLADPLVIRIPSNTTVYGLRKILAKCFSRILRTDHQYYRQSLASAAGESTSERPSTTVVNDGNGDNSDGAYDPLSDPEMLIIRQVPLAYTPEQNKTSHGTQLGSLDRDTGRDSSRPVLQLASATDDDEKVLVAQVVGPRGQVYMDWSEDLADKYLDLEEYSKTVDHKNSGQEDSMVSTRRKAGSLSVLDCIEKYCQKEQLEESEMWYCNRCKEHVQAWKQFHLYRGPPILIIHLKRFMFSATNHRRDKINTFIDFPLEGLDLTGQVMHWTEEEKPIYDCYAVSNHYGGLGGGHYTAYALNDDGKWCYYDDSRVSMDADVKQVVSEAAYVLYYRRRDVPVGEDFVVNMQSTPGVQTPAIIQDPLGKIGESSDDVSSSNAAMVDSDEHMDVDDADLASRSTSPMGSIDNNGVHFEDDPVFGPRDGKLDDDFPPLQ